MKNVEKYRSAIQARLNELRARLEKVEETLDEPADPDLADQAIELEDDEVLEGVGRASQREIRQLEEALKRIEAGTYGICAQCGEDISGARLDAVPFAQLCRACASAAAT